MDFKAENFPLYQLLLELGQPGVETAIADFEAAVKGGDEEKFLFALGIQTVAINVQTGVADYTVVPGNTQEINEKTLRSCRAVFEDIASRGHEGAMYMVASFNERGLGIPDAPAPRKAPAGPRP